ncbi:hypothetical protein DVK06_02370 [Halorubrum sp. Atlit-28R]|nr:hypothetical protein DVK06_02370 [Halorubrum sp. Atlit-28R]
MLPTDTRRDGEWGGRRGLRADGGASVGDDGRGRRGDATGDDGVGSADSESGDDGRRPLGPADSESVVDRDDLLGILGNRRRRLLWALLHRRDGPVSLAEASRRVAARERGIDPAAVASEERKSVYASLYQHHCPVMAEAGAIEFDREASTVAAVPAAERQRFLDLEIDSRAVARAVAGALAAAAGLVGVGWALNAPGLASLSPVGFGVAVAVSAGVSAAVYAAVVSRRYPVLLGDLLSAADGTER